MSDDQYQTEVDPLALGLTRSPMFMGVNVRLFFANVVICSLICIDAKTWLGVPLFLVAHLVLFNLSLNEPDYLFIQVKSLIKTPPVLNRWYWGKINSYEPW